MAAGGHRAAMFDDGVPAVESEAEVMVVREVGDVGMGFLES